MIILNKSDVSFINSIDPVGNIFFWQNRVFRAINENYLIDTKRLLSSGLINELVQKRLLVETTIADDLALEGYSLILEHEKITYISSPYEWTFNMLKDVAIAYLEIFQICKKYGYVLKDGHLLNFTFVNYHPVFFDLGSIVKGKSDYALLEFYNSVIIPLKIWSKGDFYLANLILRDDYSHNRFLPSKSLLNHKTLRSFVPFSEKFLFCFLFKVINRITKIMLNKNIPPISCFSGKNLLKKILRIRRKPVETTWSKYHDAYSDNTNIRFNRIIEVIRGLGLKSMIDLAGNKGCFSILVSRRTNIRQIYCTDYDESAVDALYLIMKKNEPKNITPMLLNFVCPILSNREAPKADIAVALAVTHHLLLTQSFTIDKIFDRIAAYSNRFVLIEFMPLGLWDGKNSTGAPAWYNIDWFRDNFKKKFKLLQEEQTEPNRIFFIGETNK